MHNPMDLTGRRILVTGASSGIGRATAIMLGRLGAQVVLVARNEDRLRETLRLIPEGEHIVVPCDLGDEAQVEKLFGVAVSDGRKLQGLVHSAGIGALVPLQMTTPKLISEVMGVNFFAFLMLARQFIKKKFSEGGSVVAISSVASEAAQPGLSAYCGSKGALDAAVRALALELVPKRIRVNSVLPCYVKTPMHDEAVATLPEDKYRAVAAAHPMGLAEPDDVANVVAFLLSDAARFINGAQIPVDGGYLA